MLGSFKEPCSSSKIVGSLWNELRFFQILSLFQTCLCVEVKHLERSVDLFICLLTNSQLTPELISVCFFAESVLFFPLGQLEYLTGEWIMLAAFKERLWKLKSSENKRQRENMKWLECVESESGQIACSSFRDFLWSLRPQTFPMYVRERECF